MNNPITEGLHHVGLTVSDLTASADFFTAVLGWKEVGGNADYPAIFVSDGNVMVTLWQTREAPAIGFDKDRNVGLHHVAFRVATEAALHEVHERVSAAGARIEFAPELLRQGPAKHMMCYDPSGVRVEFFWQGA